MAKRIRPVMIMAGGTGGHVFPALAVARELQSRDIPVIWLGTHRGIEARIIPEEGIEINWLAASGLRGKGISKLFKAPFMLSWSVLQALWIVLKKRPKAVLGMGGFVTGPGGLASRILLKPLIIQEQNAVAGMTNRLLAKIANQVCEAFPGSFSSGKPVLLTGNPVRADIVNLPTPEVRFKGRTGPIRLLVIGGSLGAQAINAVLPQALANLAEDQRPEVRHQAGERNFEQAHEYYQQAHITVELTAFIDDMAEAYAWADVVLCRAGALTISELTAAGIGSILVPFPHAVDDHQTKNASFITDAKAGELISQRELSVERLTKVLASQFGKRDELLIMACAARSLAITDSAVQVADVIVRLGKY